jgi:hypothetical protein
MLLAFTASTDLCSGPLRLLMMCKDESLSFFVIMLLCFISHIVNAFEATEMSTIFQQMCVEHGLQCAAALGVLCFIVKGIIF